MTLPGLLLSVLLLATTSADATRLDPQRACASCHPAAAAARGSPGAGHADLACADCHAGRTFNPHVPPAVDEESALVPEGLRACGDCHPEAVDALAGSVHGDSPGSMEAALRPSCVDCHGSLHAGPVDATQKRRLAGRCVGCHGFGATGAGGVTPVKVDTYRDTIHGKMLALGNPRAAACPDCHGSHDIRPGADPASRVHSARRVETCQRCHDDADQSFVAAISHDPPTLDHDFWGGVFALGFSALTVGAIFLLFLHVLADLFRSGRRALAAHGASAVRSGPVDAEEEVRRFDPHQLLQHWLIIASFIVLVLTGWPLKAASLDVSSALVEALGGQAAMSLVHRIAGAVMLVASVYHLAYLLVGVLRRKMSWGMIPTLQDLRDLWGNIAYFLGLRAERPKFGKWAYHEKFDYWAVFWGVAIMGGSGLLLWFPVWSARLFPGQVIELGHIAHSDEALLALLAVFLWHFYNVHLRPTVFPMSWVWLTGRISAEAMYEEHRAEYEARFGTALPPRSEESRSWHHHPVWSYAGVATVVIAAAVVLAANIGQVRGQVAALGEPATMPSYAAVRTPAAPDVPVQLFETCFGCHPRQRQEAGGAGFPHKLHFDEVGLDMECDGCHRLRMHQSQTTSTELCLECHEAGEVGVNEG